MHAKRALHSVPQYLPSHVRYVHLSISTSRHLRSEFCEVIDVFVVAVRLVQTYIYLALRPC